MNKKASTTYGNDTCDNLLQDVSPAGFLLSPASSLPFLLFRPLLLFCSRPASSRKAPSFLVFPKLSPLWWLVVLLSSCPKAAHSRDLSEAAPKSNNNPKEKKPKLPRGVYTQPMIKISISVFMVAQYASVCTSNGLV